MRMRPGTWRLSNQTTEIHLCTNANEAEIHAAHACDCVGDQLAGSSRASLQLEPGVSLQTRTLL